MKILRIALVLVLLIAPPLARALWFYNGLYTRTAPISMPDYASVVAPTPPLSTPAPASDAPREITNKLIVVDMAHDNAYNPPEIETLTRELVGRGARLEVIEHQANNGLSDLFESENTSASDDVFKRASAYLVIAPTTPFTPDEIRQVQQFVSQGGRVLMIADATRPGFFADGVTGPNSLLAPFDLLFSDDYLYNMTDNEGNYRNVIFRKFAQDPLTERLTSVALYAVRSVSTSSGTPLIQADERTFSSLTDAGGHLAAAALSADGQVLALGDMTFLTPPYHQVADNGRLITGLADFLLGGQYAPALADMPHLFTRPVSILATRNVTVTADLFKSVSKLQAALKPDMIPVTVVTKPVDGLDLIVLGTYAPSGDFVPYLQSFYPDLPVTPEDKDIKNKDTFITVPGVGKVLRWGTGLMILDRSEERTTLILIADDPDRLTRLLDVLAAGDLSNCAIRDQLALCNLLRSGESRTPPKAPSLLPFLPSDEEEEPILP